MSPVLFCGNSIYRPACRFLPHLVMRGGEVGGQLGVTAELRRIKSCNAIHPLPAAPLRRCTQTHPPSCQPYWSSCNAKWWFWTRRLTRLPRRGRKGRAGGCDVMVVIDQVAKVPHQETKGAQNYSNRASHLFNFFFPYP